MKNANTAALEGFLLKHSVMQKEVEADAYPGGNDVDAIRQAIGPPTGRQQDEPVFNRTLKRRNDDGTSSWHSSPMHALTSAGRPAYGMLNPLAYAPMLAARFQSQATPLRLSKGLPGLERMQEMFAHRHEPKPTIAQRGINLAMSRLMS